MKKFNENFLNNQNYILWKFEKRDILIKYFIVKITRFYFFKWMDYFYMIVSKSFLFIIFMVIFWVIIFFLYIFTESELNIVYYFIIVLNLFIWALFVFYRISKFGFFKYKWKDTKNLKEVLYPPFNRDKSIFNTFWKKMI